MFQSVPGERGRRPASRPVARWEDSLNQFARSRKIKLTDIAQDRDHWRSLEDDYVAFGANFSNMKTAAVKADLGWGFVPHSWPARDALARP